MKRLIALLLAGLSVGGLVFIYSYKAKQGNLYDALQKVPESELLPSPTEGDSQGNSISESGFSFVITTVKPGDVVNVNTLNVSIPVFVVVYKDENGMKGELLGVSDLVEQGFYTDLSVSLDKPVASGDTIYAELYSDDGNGEFGDRTDIPLLDSIHKTVVRKVLVTS